MIPVFRIALRKETLLDGYFTLPEIMKKFFYSKALN